MPLSKHRCWECNIIVGKDDSYSDTGRRCELINREANNAVQYPTEIDTKAREDGNRPNLLWCAGRINGKAEISQFIAAHCNVL
ncbi:hypothetical protein M378DRAFT_728557 [Amanita muscaria Koide BX008]|uniref:Uncharacterized protein n=1 Tax=Amanita muscaria (strain Koide BX008) TaxID=946122 RepID=A0A0C2T8Z9_AMAMK|nr:hypothetical protein M378DRAFT_728557 [Amanita muscaria Koide BX008]